MEHSHPLLVGMEDSSEGLVLAHGTPTYVFVYELALVPVIQVDELGGTLLLPVHPGTDVLTAGLRVEVGALPVPGEDKTRPLGHCPGWRTDLRTDGELSRGQLTGIEFPSEAWHAAHTWDIKRRMGLASSNPQRPTVCAQTAFPMQMQGCLISPRLALPGASGQRIPLMGHGNAPSPLLDSTYTPSLQHGTFLSGYRPVLTQMDPQDCRKKPNL